jgi:hypothetical protein
MTLLLLPLFDFSRPFILSLFLSRVFAQSILFLTHSAPIRISESGETLRLRVAEKFGQQLAVFVFYQKLVSPPSFVALLLVTLSPPPPPLDPPLSTSSLWHSISVAGKQLTTRADQEESERERARSLPPPPSKQLTARADQEREREREKERSFLRLHRS